MFNRTEKTVIATALRMVDPDTLAMNLNPDDTPIDLGATCDALAGRIEALPAPVSIHDKIGLAICFGAALGATLPADKLAELVARNKVHDPLDPVCFSHDYCDANMVMLAAWADMFGGEPDLESDADMALMTEAWAIARSANFYA